jgi:hypothetical protein
MKAFLIPLLLATAAPAQPDPGARPPDTVVVAGIEDAPRRGTYVEAALGVFTAMGGTRPFSSGEPFLAMTLGRDLGSHASVFVSLGLGATRASCYQPSPTKDSCLGADSFGATFLELGISYGFAIAARTTLGAKVLGGFTDLSPGPVQANGAVPDHVPGLHAGAGLFLDYDTRLDHFAVGIDTVMRETFARYGVRLPSLVLMPRIRYVF